jgi:serine/threonine protein kinase
MGAVYLAYQHNLRRDVAVKVLPSSLANDPQYVERFNREARTAAALEHPHIVPVYDYGTESESGISYVVMRLLTGGSLSDRLEQHGRGRLPLPSLEEISEITRQLADALDYAHARGVIHRDIKASNVMFDQRGTAYLVDFGIAKLINATNALTGTGQAMGTPSYMAPEQWSGQNVTPAVDQYALGVLVYALFTGRLPFDAETPYQMMHKHLFKRAEPITALRGDLPEALWMAVDRALAKTPEERYPLVSDFANDLRKAVRALPAYEATGFFTAPLPDTTPRDLPKRPAFSGEMTTPAEVMDGPTAPTPVSPTPVSHPTPPAHDTPPAIEAPASAAPTKPEAITPLVTPARTAERPRPRLSVLAALGGIMGLVIVAGLGSLLSRSNADSPSSLNTQAFGLSTLSATHLAMTSIASVALECYVRPINEGVLVRVDPDPNAEVALSLDSSVRHPILDIDNRIDPNVYWYMLDGQTLTPPQDRELWIAAADVTLEGACEVWERDVIAPPSTPAASAETTDQFHILVNAGRNVFIRPEPDITSPALDTVGADTQLRVLGRTENNWWYQVEYEDAARWILTNEAFVTLYRNGEPALIAEVPVVAAEGYPVLATVLSNRQVSIREIPEIMTTPIATLTEGEAVVVIGRTDDDWWYQIEYEGGTAWILQSDTLIALTRNSERVSRLQVPVVQP